MSEKDDFWDLSNLIPAKKTAGMSKFATKPTVSDVEITGSAPNKSEDGKLNFSAFRSDAQTATDETYVPNDNPWIKKVTIRRDRGRFDFYDSFRRSAELYFDVSGSACDFTPFYSYMPQYAQMNKPQKEYYFYFRSQIRKNVFIKTDYSYLYLFVYEILNLPEKFPPERGIDLLCNLWIAYRKDLPAIDKYFSVWIQDYCLIYRLPAPIVKLRPILPSVLPNTGFREFFLAGEDVSGDEIYGLLNLLSDYDWRSGRYAAGESAAAYRNHMIGAMRPVIRKILTETPSGSESLLVREAFPCSLCTHKVKSRFEIVYTPIASSSAVRNAVTNAVRYTENCLRSSLGVKSRLAVKDIRQEDKQIIDAYFADIFRKINEAKRKAEIPSYEKLYDAPKEALSVAGASDLENSSWGNTLRLINEEEAEEIRILSENGKPSEENSVPVLPIANEDKTEIPDDYGLNSTEIDYISAVFAGDPTERKRALDLLQEDELPISERINNAFSEHFGDIILELGADEVFPVEDYREDVEQWLKNIRK